MRSVRERPSPEAISERVKILPALHLPGLAHPPPRELHDDDVGGDDLCGFLGRVEIAVNRCYLNHVAEAAKNFGGIFRIVRVELAALAVEGGGAVDDENALLSCCSHDGLHGALKGCPYGLQETHGSRSE